MQVGRWFKRVVSLVATVSIVATSCLISSGAASEVYTSIGSFWTMVAQSWKSGFLVDAVIGAVCDEACPYSDDFLHHGTLMSYVPNRDHTFNAVCQYCGATFPAYDADLAATYYGFVDGLENTTVSNPVVIPDGYASYNGVILPNIDSVWTDKLTYPYAVILLYESSGYQVIFSTHAGEMNNNGRYSFPYTVSANRYKVVDNTWTLASAYDSTIGGWTSANNPIWTSYNLLCENGSVYLAASNPIVSGGISSDFDSDSSTRPTSVMDVINQWNKDNPITTNSTTVNYYIMPTDTEDLYSPALYDEEELVYTDPVTGTEYLTNGWTYDYLTRCYTLDMADGFTIGDTAIDTIKLTYGDELLTVDHYSGGSLIQSDEYNYVMASGSDCGLNGHSYTYETVKEPTCTTMGERKYTCSVCGDEYAENVPASGHTHVFSILKEATCTAAGIGVYSCSTCGSEYTEPIPATNHTGVLLETVSSEFDENGVLISRGYSVYECSVCGTQYTVQDEISTDDGDWFSFMGDLLKSFLKTIVTALGAGLSKLFSAIADFFSWIFSFLSETVLSGIKNFFDAFDDDSSIFDGFRQENEDGSSTVALPSGVATVFQFVSGTILLLPDDLRFVLFFGVAALFLIAVFKSRP